MHHTHFRPRDLLLGGLLLALFLVGRPAALTAQIPGTSGSALMVPIGGTVPLQMTTKKAISLVKNTKEDVLGIKTVPGDPSRVLLTGTTAGITHVDLTDVDGKVEGFDVTVQLDVEYLRTQLRRALPTSNIDPIPIANNTIVLRGTVNHIEDVDVAIHAAQAAVAGAQVVSDLRVAGVQQVQLCVTVAQVSRNELRQMNFDFLTDSKNFFFGSTVGGAVTQPVLAGGTSTLTSTLFNQGVPLSGIPGAGSNILFGVLHNGYGFLGFLQALRTDNVVKSIAEPTLTTMSGRAAHFLVGGTQEIPQPGGLGTISVTERPFGTTVEFVPIVLGNGKIHLEVHPKVSSLNAANGTTIQGTVVPGLNVAEVNTTVELEDGQTFVIGGLIQRDIQGTTIKTPILGDLPFLGTAFSSKSYDETEMETVILVTPHLVDAEDCSQAPKILPGDETRRPDDFELFLEGILEAPRGPREVCPNHHYVAAFKNGPTAALFPCAGKGGCGAGGCANGGGGEPGLPVGEPGQSASAAPAMPMAAAAPAVPTATINLTPLRSSPPLAPVPANAAAPVPSAPPGELVPTADDEKR